MKKKVWVCSLRTLLIMDARKSQALKWPLLSPVGMDLLFSFIITYTHHISPHTTAGVIALMLEASNNTLTSREIAHILIDTAIQPKKVNWTLNGAGYKMHPQV